MRKQKLVIVASGLAIATALFSAASAPASPAGAKTSVVKGLAGITGMTKGQIKQWKTLVAQAQQEGHLVVLVGKDPSIIGPFFNDFQSEFGIQVTLIGGSPTSLSSRVLAERQQGLHIEDIADLGSATEGRLITAGAFQPLLPNVILKADLNRSKGWYSNTFPWCDVDPTKMYCTDATMTPGQNVINIYYNSQLVSQKEIAKIKSYNDLLNPKYAGKVAIQNVALGFDSSALELGWYELGEKYWEKFMKVLKPTVLSTSTSDTDAINGLARGEWDFTLFNQSTAPYQLAISQGLPIKELTRVIKPGSLANFGQRISLLGQAPDQAAAELFLNWFLAPEGQAAFNKDGAAIGDVALRSTAPRGNVTGAVWQAARRTRTIYTSAKHPQVIVQAQGWFEQTFQQMGLPY